MIAVFFWTISHFLYFFIFLFKEKRTISFLAIILFFSAYLTNKHSVDLSFYLSYFISPDFYELGWRSLSSFFRKFFGPFGTYYSWVLIYFILVCLIFRKINIKNKKLFLSSIAIFFGSIFFALAVTNNLRQSVSILIFFYGVLFLLERKVIIGSLILYASSLFHDHILNNALFFIPFVITYYFLNLKFGSKVFSTNQKIFFLFLSGLASGFILNLILQTFFFEYESVSNEFLVDRVGNEVRFIFFLLQTILIMIIYERNFFYNTFKVNILNIIFFAIIFYTAILVPIISYGDSFIRLSVALYFLQAVFLSITGSHLIYIKPLSIKHISWMALFVIASISPNVLSILYRSSGCILSLATGNCID